MNTAHNCAYPELASLEGIRFEELIRERICLAVPPHHAFGKETVIVGILFARQADERRLVRRSVETTLRRALAGAWGVFGVQNSWEAGVEREEAQGKRLATLAREAGVEHFVYTSVGSAHKRTGVPHFDNKWRIEETVRGLRFPSHVILRPVFFMENLLAPYSLQGDTLASALGPSTKLQMIAVDDIGWFGARAFTDAAALNRREIDLAGDVRTMPGAAEVLTEALGRPIAFAQTPIEQVRQHSEDTALMLEWFERVGYSADIAGLEREFGRVLTKLPNWARRLSQMKSF